MTTIYTEAKWSKRLAFLDHVFWSFESSWKTGHKWGQQVGAELDQAQPKLGLKFEVVVWCWSFESKFEVKVKV